jgi:Ca-activated chloride channel family protein
MPADLPLSFAQPAFLLLALLVPPLVWLWLRQRRSALHHPVAGLLPTRPAVRSRRARTGGAVLRGLGLLLLVVAVAGPRRPDLRTRAHTEGIALVLAVDVSGSMAEADFDWNGKPITRLGAVKRVFRLFVVGGASETGDGVPANFEGRPTDLIGLVTFGTRAEAPCPLTLSHSSLLRVLDDERPRQTAGEQETNLSDAIALGLHRLHSAGPRRRVLVLLTDGEHNQFTPPSGLQPKQAAQIAASLGVPIHTIDAGPPPGTDPTLAAQRAEGIQGLKDVATISGGRYFTARDTAALIDTLRAIDRLERDRIETFQFRRYHEVYPWFALASFVLIVAAVALDLTLWRRVP